MRENENNFDLKQREILTTAARLFKINGYERTSLEEIAAATGLKKGSLYYYFKSKQDILAQISTKGLEKTLKTVSAVNTEQLPVTVKMRKLIYTYVLEIIANLDFISVCFKDEGSLEEENRKIYLKEQDVLENIFYESICDGIANNEFAAVNPKLTTFLIFGVCHHLIRWYQPGKAYSPEYVATEFSTYICDLMLTRK